MDTKINLHVTVKKKKKRWVGVRCEHAA